MALARTRRDLEPPPDWLGEPGELPALLEAADFVVIACPLNEATRGLIGRREFAHMKPEAVLINVARGPIVDEDALYEALEPAGRSAAPCSMSGTAIPSRAKPPSGRRAIRSTTSTTSS